MRSSVNIVAAVLLAGCTSPEVPPSRNVLAAYSILAAAPDGDTVALARVIVDAGQGCPSLVTEAGAVAMTARGNPDPARFPVVVCEAVQPFGAAAQVEGSGDRAAGRDALAGADRGGGRHGLRHLAGLRRPGGLAVRTAGRAGGGHRAGPGDPCRRLCLSRHAGHDRGQRRQARHLQCGQLRARGRILPAARPLCQPERRRQLAAGQLGGVAGRFLRAGGTAPEPGALGAGAGQSRAVQPGGAGLVLLPRPALRAARRRAALPGPAAGQRRPAQSPPVAALSAGPGPAGSSGHGHRQRLRPASELPRPLRRAIRRAGRAGRGQACLAGQPPPDLGRGLAGSGHLPDQQRHPAAGAAPRSSTRPCRKAWSWCCPAISIASRR